MYLSIDSEQMFFTTHHHIIKSDHKQHKQKSKAATTITRAPTVSTMKHSKRSKTKGKNTSCGTISTTTVSLQSDALETGSNHKENSH